MAGTAGTLRPQPQPQQMGATATRWMWTWVTIGILVLIVVVGFLLGIVGALEAIDSNLAEADTAVTSIGSDVDPLPTQIGSINENLTNIDVALKDIPGQAEQIVAALTSIRDSAASIDASLQDTSGDLRNTSGVLVNVSNTLKPVSATLGQVLDLARQIEQQLESAQSPPDDLGTEDIWQRLDIANGVLAPARSDTQNILAGLQEVNKHLQSICEGLIIPGPC
ncbi:MAG: hypothetical protein KY462_00615 [Actinobacteria bacterium]|nr:hypothetical protein [Actinomycetota bacterium]